MDEIKKNHFYRTFLTFCLCRISNRLEKKSKGLTKAMAAAASSSVTAGSGSFSEDQYGKKIDRCITDTLVKAGMYTK